VTFRKAEGAMGLGLVGRPGLIGTLTGNGPIKMGGHPLDEVGGSAEGSAAKDECSEDGSHCGMPAAAGRRVA
jgi:hypothetical protein